MRRAFARRRPRSLSLENGKSALNDNFLSPSLDVDEFIERFEVESREVFAARRALTALVDLKPGQDVADVGSGTGLFLRAFADAVGPGGTVYAVDISQGFVEYIGERARAAGLDRVQPHRCREDAIDLPEDSLDRVFLCDTYHHLEYPRPMMSSVHAALRAGGEVVLVDYDRIPGVTREWLMEHVRAGKGEVLAEMDSFGFELLEEAEVPGLVENYAVRFRKR